MKNAETEIITFSSFNFSPEMTRAVTELGYTSPTPIQQQTLPILLAKEPTDFLGLAATGTGKTAAFAIPLLEKLDANHKGAQALILCPTRELAKQVSEQINLLARYKKIKALAIYGGSDYGGQLRALKDGVGIIVGTPGRIIDHLERKTLNLDHLKTLILDEADEMISMGFKEEIEFILETANENPAGEKHETWLFSATMSPTIRRIADEFLSKPKQIQVNKTDMVTTQVKQFYYRVYEDDKPEVIEKLIDQVPGFYGLIFCQTKILVTDLTQLLKNDGYSADCLHGDMEQAARERTMKAFKAKNCTILVCTDVASRGLDVKDLTHVINYSLPRELDLYVHRIGRTGRGGKEGLALSLVTSSHMGLVSRIEKTTKSKMTLAQVPTQAEVMAIRIKKSLEDFSADVADTTIDVSHIQDLVRNSGWKPALEQMSKEEIVARFLSKSLKGAAPKKVAAPNPNGATGFVDNGTSDSGSRGDRESRRPRRERGSYADRGYPERGARGADRGNYAPRPKRDFSEKPKSFGERAPAREKRQPGSTQSNKSRPFLQ